MLLGSSGTLIVTVNEEVVYDYTNSAGRAYAVDTDLVKFPVPKGRNRLLVVSRQGIGRWGFGIQFAKSPVASHANLARTLVAKVDDLRRVALQHRGDPRRGEQLFFDPKGVGCVRCHAAGGRGDSSIGPDLTGLALKYDRDELIRSVLEPSSRIATGYQPVIVATRDGKVLTGVVRGETGDWLELADSEAKITRVLKLDITERRVGEVSIMPKGMAERLSPAEFSDLISFLESLKQAPVSAGGRVPLKVERRQHSRMRVHFPLRTAISASHRDRFDWSGLGESRTPTPSRTSAPKTDASAIPPRGLSGSTIRNHRKTLKAVRFRVLRRDPRDYPSFWTPAGPYSSEPDFLIPAGRSHRRGFRRDHQYP